MTQSPLTPRQARSRETERKLIEATIGILVESGLEGASIPRVAERAGVTPGAVYRRFPDKNALLERVILSILEMQCTQLQHAFAARPAHHGALVELVERLVQGMVASYRRNATLINAMRQFVRGSDHRAFKRKAVDLENRTLEQSLEMLMRNRDEMRHPEPRSAVRLAFITLSGTLMTLFISGGGIENRQRLVPQDDAWLVRELTRMFLRYVGAG